MLSQEKNCVVSREELLKECWSHLIGDFIWLIPVGRTTFNRRFQSRSEAPYVVSPQCSNLYFRGCQEKNCVVKRRTLERMSESPGSHGTSNGQRLDLDTLCSKSYRNRGKLATTMVEKEMSLHEEVPIANVRLFSRPSYSKRFSIDCRFLTRFGIKK